MPFEKRIPEGDTRERDCCTDCDFIDFQNPRIVTGALIRDRDNEDRVLLHQTGGLWTLPYSYMLQGEETTLQHAARITLEKTGFEAETDTILAIDEMVADRQVIFTFAGFACATRVLNSPQGIARFFNRREIPSLLDHDPAVLNILEKDAELRKGGRFAPSLMSHEFSRVTQFLAAETVTINTRPHVCGEILPPKMVAGLTAEYNDRVALGLRPFPPGWIIFSGYVEGGETLQNAAVRETGEEGYDQKDGGKVAEAHDLTAVYEIPHRSEIIAVFRGVLKSPDLKHNPELQDARLFGWDELPPNFAFPMVPHALNKHWRNKDKSLVAPCHMYLPPILRGSPPPDPQPIGTYRNG